MASSAYWPDAIEGLGPSQIGPYTRCDLCGAGTWTRYGAVPLCLACARSQANPALEPAP